MPIVIDLTVNDEATRNLQKFTKEMEVQVNKMLKVQEDLVRKNKINLDSLATDFVTATGVALKGFTALEERVLKSPLLSQGSSRKVPSAMILAVTPADAVRQALITLATMVAFELGKSDVAQKIAGIFEKRIIEFFRDFINRQPKGEIPLDKLFERRDQLLDEINRIDKPSVSKEFIDSRKRAFERNQERIRKRLDEVFPTGVLPDEQQPSLESMLKSQTEASQGFVTLSKTTEDYRKNLSNVVATQGEFSDSANGVVVDLVKLEKEESRTQQAIAGTNKEVGLSKRAFDGFSSGVKGNLGKTKEGVFSLGKAVQETSATMGAALNSGFSDAIFNTITGRFDNLKNVGLSVANSIARAFSNLAAGAIITGIGALVGFAEGGLITKPTMALLGEAGPEVVLPLQLLRATLGTITREILSAVLGSGSALFGGSGQAALAAGTVPTEGGAIGLNAFPGAGALGSGVAGGALGISAAQILQSLTRAQGAGSLESLGGGAAGAIAGGVLGGLASGGNPLGIFGGAAVGGFIGSTIGSIFGGEEDTRTIVEKFGLPIAARANALFNLRRLLERFSPNAPILGAGASNTLALLEAATQVARLTITRAAFMGDPSSGNINRQYQRSLADVLGRLQGFDPTPQELADIGILKIAAHGMNERVHRPTLILAGEAGPEHVNITPLRGRTANRATGAIQIHIDLRGSTITSRREVDHLAAKIEAAIRRRTRLRFAAA